MKWFRTTLAGLLVAFSIHALAGESVDINTATAETLAEAIEIGRAHV